tara:strand:- start:465 stop:1253 length:789 start_codon:yes stop_codon:yes gene_type:complete
MKLKDATEEDLEVIRLLKVDEVLSKEARVVIVRLKESVKNLKELLPLLLKPENIMNLPNKLPKAIGELSPAIKINNTPVDMFDLEEQRLNQISYTSLNIIRLISDAEKKDKQKLRLDIGNKRKMINKIIKMEEKEIRQIKANSHTILSVFHFLQNARAYRNIIVRELNGAIENFHKANNIMQKKPSNMERRMANGFTSSMKDCILRAKQSTDALFKILEGIFKIIRHFENYLELVEKESKATLTYEKMMGGVFSTIKPDHGV